MAPTVAFLRIVELHQALGLPPLNQLPAPWKVDVDEDWRIVMNQTAESLDAIPPYTATCYYRDSFLPALMVNPGGGIQMGHDGEAEREFIAAVEKRCRALGVTEFGS